MDEIKDRLEKSRRKAGFTSAPEAAEAFGWNVNTYKSHENGVRGLRDQDTVRRYARAFGVDFNWLLTGTGSAERRNIVVVRGRVGAGAEILPEFEQAPPEGLFEIEVPFPVGDDALAFEVEGDSMWPRYDPGDVIICGRSGIDVDQIVGWEAAVRTNEGRRYLKKIRRGSKPGLFDLESHNASPIRDQKLEWVAEIEHVIRSGRWKPLDRVARQRLVARTLKRAHP